MESSDPRWASLGRCVMPSTAMKKKVRTGRRILCFPSPSPLMNTGCCIHPSGWGSGVSEASGSQCYILCWECQALNPGLVLAWAWAGLRQSLPRQLLFPSAAGAVAKPSANPCALLREEDLPQALPCPWHSLPRCPRSPEFTQGSQEDEI